MNYALLIVYLETRVVALENSLKGELQTGMIASFINTEISVAKYQIDLIQRLMYDNEPAEVEALLAPPKRSSDPIPAYSIPLLEKPTLSVTETGRRTLEVGISSPNYTYKLEVNDNMEVRSTLLQLVTGTPDQVQRLTAELRKHIVRA